jgi:hypothetical protein
MIRHAAGGVGSARALFALTVVIAGCTGREPPKIDENLFPANYKADILKVMPDILGDPTNIRDAFISEPALMPFRNVSRYTVCVRFNPRTSGRRYAGSQDRIGIFLAGELQQFVPATPEQCGKAAYKPFPELEKLCHVQRCD